MSSHHLSVRGIDVYYDKVHALKAASVDLDEGDIIAVIGANGAGKSTLLRAITGLVQVSTGEIHVRDRRIDGLRPDQIARLGIAMVPEGRRIYPLMNVRDNLLMGAYLRKDKKAISEDLERLYMRFPRVKERLGQQGVTLSGGE